MRRVLAAVAAVAVVAGGLVVLDRYGPAVADRVENPVPLPAPSQDELERLQTEITATLTTTDQAWAVAVGDGVVEVTLSPGQEAIGAQLLAQYGDRIVVRYLVTFN